ncbi:OB-fold domain-containing protein [Candidatus Phytoplasma rubi]|nr:OB-fold domain-containing protein [Candidatus Phytoplasma rubi]
MYFYIKGKVTFIQNDSVVLDNNGIGYQKEELTTKNQYNCYL